MRTKALFVIGILLVLSLAIAPAAAGFYTSHNFNPPQISAPRTYLSGLDVRDISTFHQFQVQIQGMNLTPPPIPQMSLKSYNGKYDYNWGSDRFKPGGVWVGF